MTKAIPHNMGAVSAVFADVEHDAADELGAGITSGFGVISFRGKVWRIKHRGEETNIMREDGDGPRSNIEVVIIKASPHLSKIFYKNGYVEGSTEAPDCWSNNGVTPDAAVTEKQNPTCALCKQNAWGSKLNPSGKPGKACADAKRIAVVPLNDIENEVYGGPMLLRVPAASLSDMKTFNEKMKALGYPYFSIGTRVTFDIDAEYQKLVFGAIRTLTDLEAVLVKSLRDDPRTARVLSEDEHVAAPLPVQQQIENAFEQPPKVTEQEAKLKAELAKAEQLKADQAADVAKAIKAAKAAPKKAAAKAEPKQEALTVAATVAKPAEEGHDPETGEIVPSSFDADLDAQLDGLI